MQSAFESTSENLKTAKSGVAALSCDGRQTAAVVFLYSHPTKQAIVIVGANANVLVLSRVEILSTLYR